MTAPPRARSALFGLERLPTSSWPGSADIQRARNVVRTLPPAPGHEVSTAVLTNLIDVIVHGCAEVYECAAKLPLGLGRQLVADVRCGLDALLETGPGVPFATAAIVELSCTARVQETLSGAGRSSAEARRIAIDCADGAFWLLMTGVEESRPSRVPASPDELRWIVEKHGADRWRRILANIATNPWEPGGPQVADLARSAGLPAAARAIERCTQIYRARAEDSDKRAIAREIRRLVAVSGCSQREFAAYLGTSGPRLSTYVNGTVTPSATRMLRIKRVAAMLERRPRIAGVASAHPIGLSEQSV